MFESLKKINNEESAISDTSLIQERVVICSAFTLGVFKEHIKKQGALGLLALPFIKKEVI